VPLITCSDPVAPLEPVYNALELLMLLLEALHAQIVMLPNVLLVLVLQLHARLVPMANFWTAQHAQHVILDALLVLEKENAQPVTPIII